MRKEGGCRSMNSRVVSGELNTVICGLTKRYDSTARWPCILQQLRYLELKVSSESKQVAT